jgi:hypothetical protein
VQPTCNAGERISADTLTAGYDSFTRNSWIFLAREIMVLVLVLALVMVIMMVLWCWCWR